MQKKLIILSLFLALALCKLGNYPRSNVSCDATSADDESGANAGFFWDGQKCENCANDYCFCSEYNGCTGCISGYSMYTYSDSVKQCYSCNSYTLTNYATSCCIFASHTYIDAPQFAISHTACESTTTSTAKLFGSVCYRINGCATYYDNGNCKTCLDGYYWNYDTTTSYSSCRSCYNSVTNCAVCQVHGQCSKCYDGFYLVTSDSNPSSSCTACSSNCTCTGEKDSTTGNLDTCSGCISDYYIFDSDDLNCSTCASYNLKNCITCTNASGTPTCKTCSTGFVLNSTKTECLECSDNCYKCELMSSGDEEITSCSTDGCYNGYYREKADGSAAVCNKCSESSSSILRCNALDDITQCNNTSASSTTDHDASQDPPHNKQYYLINGKCVENKYSCKEMVASTTDGECSSCYTDRGYVLVGTQCLQCQNNQGEECLACEANDSGSLNCISCLDKGQYSTSSNYYLDTDSHKCLTCGVQGCYKCTESTTCETCLYGYMKTEANQCNSCGIDNCKVCSTSTQECNECFEGYYLYNVSGATIKCLPCDDPYCTKCTSDRKKCDACQSGYYTSSSTCHRLRANCVEWDTNTGSCTNCKNGYYAVNGWCKLIASDTMAYVDSYTGCKSSTWYRADGTWLDSYNTDSSSGSYGSILSVATTILCAILMIAVI